MLLKNIKILSQHFKRHCTAEYFLMKKFNYRNYQEHLQEHKSLLHFVVEMELKINDDRWSQNEVYKFVDQWRLHIVAFDLPANNFINSELM